LDIEDVSQHGLVEPGKFQIQGGTPDQKDLVHIPGGQTGAKNPLSNHARRAKNHHLHPQSPFC
jgi:hypothetical protein